MLVHFILFIYFVFKAKLHLLSTDITSDGLGLDFVPPLASLSDSLEGLGVSASCGGEGAPINADEK